MSDVVTGSAELISKQIAIVRRLQTSISDALDRNDSGTAQRLIDSCDKAFSTFTQGITAMAIDVSNLKHVLQTGGANTDVIQSLGDRLAQLEQKLGQFDAGAIATLQSDVNDIKTAITELNSSAATTPPAA
ncbi:MAG TPA: hypothetical protein V6D33_11865 [Cyanophyceae cyanobacterium]